MFCHHSVSIVLLADITLAEDVRVKGLAKFSEDRHYRYVLGRIWDEGATLTWIMLNPSTASASKNDPTIWQCIAFTKAWGYDGFYVVNLFGKRSPDPKVLRKWPDPVGPDNDKWIDWAVRQSATTMLAWGANAKYYPEREKQVVKRLVQQRRTLKCLGHTKGGHPMHPLRLSRQLKMVEYEGF